MAVFFVVLALGTKSLIGNIAEIPSGRGILGGPTLPKKSIFEGSLPVTALKGKSAVVADMGASAQQQTALLERSGSHVESVMLPAAFLGGAPTIVTASAAASSLRRPDVLSYKVQKGDTISGIAAQFGVTVDTILAANPTVRRSALKIGQEIAVLPVSGVLYRARDGETMYSIASLFNVPLQQVVRYNKAVATGAIAEGTLVVVPGGRVSAVRASFDNDENASLPSLKGFFEKPTDGFNWGKLHHYNAVDIAASSGTPVWASAEGLVLPETGGRGYGRFVLVEHANGTKTRYAHLEQVVVSAGDYVKQRQLIGTVGDTGESTGCHVHFEVYGAKNPFAKP